MRETERKDGTRPKHLSRAGATPLLTVENTCATDEGQSQSHESIVATDPSATSHAGPKRPATGEKSRQLTRWDAFKLPLSQSDGQFEQLLRSEDAARLLGNIHVEALQRYTRAGTLPGYRLGGHWYFRASELDAWLRSRINSSCHPCRLNQEESDGT